MREVAWVQRIHSYEPIFRSDARMLILGTMPSVKSLERGFYYAHERNAFWPIMARIFDVSVLETVEEKKAIMLTHQLALWDVAASCVREGSLDSNIRDCEPNDIYALMKQCPQIKRIVFNGAAARTLFLRYFRDLDVPGVRLPSTSPAYTLSFEEKYQAWRRIVKEET